MSMGRIAFSLHCCGGLDVCFLRTRVRCRGRPGSRSLSLSSPKKVSKERRPQCIAPSGFLVLCCCNREGRTTCFAQTSVPLFPIATTHHQQCISGKDKTARFALRCCAAWLLCELRWIFKIS